jgi:phosphotriesterase-related protein
MEQFARTLTGDVPPEKLGKTLIHEHLCVDWGEMVGRPKVLDFDFEEMVSRMVDKMEALYASGFSSLVECTPIGCGRYLDLFKEVARRGPVNIIGSTGFFHETWCPMHPIGRALDVDELTDLFTREITEGMGDTLIRAGMIKCATGEGRISANEEKILRAAARSHVNTGCPIITHTTGGGMGLEQLDIFASEGVPAEVVIISHIDDLNYAEQILQRGANLSIDRIGTNAFFPDDHWLEMIAGLLNKGYIEQVMLSHDAAVFVHGLDIVSGEKTFDDYTYISRVFLPRLREYGVSDEQIHIMLHDNPRCVLTFRGREVENSKH